MDNPRTPSGLKAAGKALWNGVLEEFELSAPELRILKDACFEADLIDRLEKALIGADLVVLGSMRQQVANPVISEIRQHRATLKTLLSALRIPPVEDVEQVPMSRADSARRAAQVRWHGGAA